MKKYLNDTILLYKNKQNIMKYNPFKKKHPGKGGTKLEVTIDGQKQIFNTIGEFAKAYDINYSTAVRWAHTDDRIKIIEALQINKD